MSESESKKIFSERLNQLMAERGITQKEISVITGASTSTVSTWSNGMNMPRMDKVERLAEHFDLPISYFLETMPASHDEELQEYLEQLKTRPEMRMLFSLTKGATKEEVERAVKIIEAALGR